MELPPQSKAKVKAQNEKIKIKYLPENPGGEIF